MPPKIAVLGSLNLDLVVKVPHYPLPGQSIQGGDLQTFCGGKGANQALAAARMGADVWMVGRVGEDAFGERLVGELCSAGVDTTWVSRVPGSSGTALIAIDPEGENRIIVSPGANATWTPADVDGVGEALRGVDAVLLQLEIPLAAVERAAQIAHGAGVRVLLDPAPAIRLPASLVAVVDDLVPNLNEAAVLVGEEPGRRRPEELAERLLELGARCVVLKLGGAGALAVTPSGRVHAPAHRVSVVDTTAAGDAFGGAFAVAMVEGMDLDGAIRLANAAGACAVMAHGAQPSLPTRAQAEELLRKQVL